MFTVQQIKAAHAKVKSGADFPAYVKEIKGLGLTRYEFMVTDGRIDYYGAGDHKVSAPAVYPEKSIATHAQPSVLKQSIKEHQQGKSNFLTFCQLAANAGVQKWVVDTQSMLCIYYNLRGEEIVVEPIPE